MDRARLNGVELEFDVKGTGEPVLLIGIGPVADSFRPLVQERALAERFRLITYRQRGQTIGTKSESPVSFATHAADAAALLGHLGVRRAHVAGHSSGAAIALQMAFDRPELVHTLTLLEPPLLGVPSAGDFFAKVGPAVAAYDAGDHEGAMVKFLTFVCGLDWETCRSVVERHIPDGVEKAVMDADTFFGSYLPALGAWQFGPGQAAVLTQPVMSVVGTETERLFAESHELLQTWFPQIESCPIEGAAHLLHLLHPTPVAECIAGFFARHPITPTHARVAHGGTAVSLGAPG